jgi:hypothetical protein
MRSYPLAATVCVLALLGSACAASSNGPGSSSASAPDPRDMTRPGVDPPMYKQSGSSEAPMSITVNAYGAFRPTPNAPQLGDIAQNFVLPLADGGQFDLAAARANGPVLIMFYRGFW